MAGATVATTITCVVAGGLGVRVGGGFVGAGVGVTVGGTMVEVGLSGSTVAWVADATGANGVATLSAVGAGGTVASLVAAAGTRSTVVGAAAGACVGALMLTAPAAGIVGVGVTSREPRNTPNANKPIALSPTNPATIANNGNPLLVCLAADAVAEGDSVLVFIAAVGEPYPSTATETLSPVWLAIAAPIKLFTAILG